LNKYLKHLIGEHKSFLMGRWSIAGTKHYIFRSYQSVSAFPVAVERRSPGWPISSLI